MIIRENKVKVDEYSDEFMIKPQDREYNPEEDLCAAPGGRMDEEAVVSGDYD